MLAWIACGAAVLATLAVWTSLGRRLERVARAAHELRAPLCAARLAIHAAARQHGWETLAAIDNELARAAVAVDDLDAARAGRAPASAVEAVALSDVLDDVRRAWASLAWPVGREVRVERTPRLPAVEGDGRRLAQAIGNLVGNALEHGAGPVVLRARAAGDRVRVEVEDRGAGLPAHLGALVRRRRGGRGARGRGLAIAAQVARRHDGRLLHERVPGGCRLVLELPVAAARRSPDLLRLRWGGVARPWSAEAAAAAGDAPALCGDAGRRAP